MANNFDASGNNPTKLAARQGWQFG